MPPEVMGYHVAGYVDGAGKVHRNGMVRGGDSEVASQRPEAHSAKGAQPPSSSPLKTRAHSSAGRAAGIGPRGALPQHARAMCP